MKLLPIVGVAAFFVSILIARTISNNALQKLSSDELKRLHDAFFKLNNYYLIFIGLLITAYLAAMTYYPYFLNYLSVGYLLIFAAYFIFKFLMNRKKLISMNVSPDYIKSFVYSYLIVLVGFVVLTATILYPAISNSQNRFN